MIGKHNPFVQQCKITHQRVEVTYLIYSLHRIQPSQSSYCQIKHAIKLLFAYKFLVKMYVIDSYTE